jgi:UDP-N-acetylenolpyruvoylglucosamine reductase
MNAGAMGNNLFDVVEKVRIMDLDGHVSEKNPSDLNVQYRACYGLRHHIALSAILRVAPGNPQEINQRLKQFEEKRWSSQPAAPSAGCIFKNLPNGSTGQLIDRLGLKGLSFGKARVSDVHGNFIVNTGGASASDVITLISMVQDRVRTSAGTELETEVVIIGDESW